MASEVNRRWLLAKRPGRQIRHDDFEWAESSLPEPAEGQMLVRNLWISLDPTLILFTAEGMQELATPIGGVMHSLGAGRVVESRHPGFVAGDVIQGWLGWEDYSVTDGLGSGPGDLPAFKIPNDLAPNQSFGALGITGMAAYFGVLDVARPRPRETFVVTSAAGGVGSVAGQIAKLQGLRVIGIASGRSRCDWVLRELGFDGAIDRQTEDVGKRMSELLPEGIDIFFDNSGLAPILDAVFDQLRPRGRVVLCGLSSWYLEDATPPGPKNYGSIIMKSARIEGVLAREYADRFPEARAALSGWIASGRMKSPEDVLVGLEKAPTALARVFEGANLGKQLVKIADV